MPTRRSSTPTRRSPMFVVRDMFTAKPGQASKLAKLMKDTWESTQPGKVRVLTDSVGDYNTVVMETEVREMSELEQRMKRYMNDPDIKKKMTGYTDLWITGRREIMRVVE